MIVLVFDEPEYLVGRDNFSFPPPNSKRVLLIERCIMFKSGYIQTKTEGTFHITNKHEGVKLNEKLIDDDIFEEIINISNEYDEIMKRSEEKYEQSDFSNRLSKKAIKAIHRVFSFLEYKNNQIINHRYNYNYEFKDENNNSYFKYDAKIISFRMIHLRKKKDRYQLYICWKKVNTFVNIDHIILKKAFDMSIYEMYVVSLILKNISDQVDKFTDNLYEEFTLMDSGNTTKSARKV